MEVIDADKLPTDDPIYIKGKALGDKFSELVDLLRTNKNPRLAMLGTLIWRLVGNHVIPVAMVEGIPTLSFTALRNPAGIMGMVICPEDWLEQIEANPLYCMGGIVFVASQCRDFWNGKILYPAQDQDQSATFGPGPQIATDPIVLKRAFAYEAEYLHSIFPSGDLKPNDYQSKVMAAYPKGLDTSLDLIYDGKPYMDAK
jgi:hypothetical protein